MSQKIIVLPPALKVQAFPWIDSTVHYHEGTEPAIKCSLDDGGLQEYNPYPNFNDQKMLGDCRSTMLVAVESLPYWLRGESIAQMQEYREHYFRSLVFKNIQAQEETENVVVLPTPSILKNMDEDSGLREDLEKIVQRIRDEWMNFTNRKETIDLNDDALAEENRMHYLDEIVPLQAFEIYEIMKTMIDQEDYPVEAFGNFEEVWTKINDHKTDKVERAKLLQKLRMIGSGKISAKITMNRNMQISPIINSMVEGSDKLVERKMTRV